MLHDVGQALLACGITGTARPDHGDHRHHRRPGVLLHHHAKSGGQTEVAQREGHVTHDDLPTLRQRGARTQQQRQGNDGGTGPPEGTRKDSRGKHPGSRYKPGSDTEGPRPPPPPRARMTFNCNGTGA
ncbi:hypothetical protein A176_001475 [Myxococcus hansupus]|uniref:Uncharacterized protein n=1 Tax=Pseudomyxococcus hansupus TaxID=1297742 RepID=A0A0H4WSN3_9BACT|nr:hypothetical protein A176_001475 [Myxococcus hansupus]